MGGWQTKFNVSLGPGLWSFVLGPSGPNLRPDLGPGPGPELDKIILMMRTMQGRMVGGSNSIRMVRKVVVVVVVVVVSGRPNLMYSPGPGLWSLDLLDLTWT